MINLPNSRIRFWLQLILCGAVAVFLLLWAIDSAKLLVYTAGIVALIASIRGLVGVLRPNNDSK